MAEPDRIGGECLLLLLRIGPDRGRLTPDGASVPVRAPVCLPLIPGRERKQEKGGHAVGHSDF